MPTFPRDWNLVVRSEAESTRSSHVATGRLDIMFANSQFRNMLEWEDPTARSDELTKAGTERQPDSVYQCGGSYLGGDHV